MGRFNIPLSASAQEGGSDGKEIMEDTEYPPMCGQVMLNKVLSKSPLKKKTFAGKKTKHSHQYEEFTGAVSSPDTESASASSDFSQDENTMQMPRYLQFDPSELKQVEQEKEEADKRKRQRQAPSSSGWVNTLPAVTEERSFEVEDVSTTSSKTNSGGKKQSVATQFSLLEKSEIVATMRNLIIKQQKIIQELSEENEKRERELNECREVIRDLYEEQKQQEVRVKELTVEKESFEAEVIWTRNEVDQLKRSAEKTSFDVSETEASTGVSSDLESYRNFKIQNEQRTVEAHDDDILKNKFEMLMMDDSFQENNSTLSNKKSDLTDKSASDNSNLSSQVEILVFKKRLEQVQKRRLSRRLDKPRVGPVVRFQC